MYLHLCNEEIEGYFFSNEGNWGLILLLGSGVRKDEKGTKT